MSSTINIYIKKENLETLLKKVGFEKGISITLQVSDEPNKYGQNVSGYITQSQEERENKESKEYVANGKVVWTNGEIKKA